jgi:protein phosphatase
MRDTPSAAAYDVTRLRTLGILPESDEPPFDIIGDVHGCINELCTLLGRLGYTRSVLGGYTHPLGRRVVFVGDLVDRGPSSVAVLDLVLAMHAGGAALLVLGNHDARFLRWLCGRKVRTTYGLAQTITELEALPPRRRESLKRRSGRLFEEVPGYLILDARRLVVTHGGIRDHMIGAWNGETASICLYGEVEGYTSSGRPLRRDWAARRHIPPDPDARAEQPTDAGRPIPYIIYGHNVISELSWVNRTLDLDTGCAYGGELSALRYPELELVQVAASRAYAHRRS